MTIGAIFGDTVRDLAREASLVRRRRFGVIEAVDGSWRSITLRAWPRLVSGWEVGWQDRRIHQSTAGDRCRLYYKQPYNCPQFLTLEYAISHRQTKLSTLLAAIRVLDEVARLKASDAIVCEATSHRLTDAILLRGGWERHCPNWRGRHFIKRFYGSYPEPCGGREMVELSASAPN